jgi:hypothetical protein
MELSTHAQELSKRVARGQGDAHIVLFTEVQKAVFAYAT